MKKDDEIKQQLHAIFGGFGIAFIILGIICF